MGEGGGHHQRLSPSPSPSAHMGRGGGMMGGLGLGSELSRQTSMGSAGGAASLKHAGPPPTGQPSCCAGLCCVLASVPCGAVPCSGSTVCSP
eukprot:scaffold137800_cov18-Tisochrysis_lutea.AAC.1